MGDVEERIRERAYILWEEAGCPDGSGEEFWFAAEAALRDQAPLEDAPLDNEPLAEGSPAELPREAAARAGVPNGMPGERIAEQGVMGDRLADLAIPALAGGEH